MPELPEVEIVCRNLAKMIGPGVRLEKWSFFRPDLRFPIPKKALQKTKGCVLTGVRRRAKYILFEFGDQIVVSHLGMTGAWREEKLNWTRQKHDHLAFSVEGGRVFVFQDPRRFGFIEVLAQADCAARFSALGAEPLDPNFSADALTRTYRQLLSPIKCAIMNQKYLVGVGNIYASEILFRARVNPFLKCSEISKASFARIWGETVKVLSDAIEKGGSTVENYRNSYGESGRFQEQHLVYGRKGEVCRKCRTSIRSEIQSGRSTFWCPGCQKK